MNDSMLSYGCMPEIGTGSIVIHESCFVSVIGFHRVVSAR